MNKHIDVSRVFVLRTDGECHVQVVALRLLNAFGLVQADTARQVGNPVLLLRLDLHASAVYRFKTGGLHHDGQHQQADSSEGQHE
ncbi:hypothetical protein D3C71_1852200 [compost metagenome]